ncbi:cobalamin biosynthesis protein [Nonomuraea sp. MG754425]|uniref:cobalamin biosynthesis protein n=1 Tax=Nonomuraea sp. MG754425 TaxID=2570319 RepID=UPI001F02B9AA|nr:cobalamin biosynthesis protein [Nonomuraea sp. MG754425]MCF6474606.1 cobalamin biosynthesis protein [Nonomuraea sp. MG754425]
MPIWCDPLGLALGVALDRLLADPQSPAHPVAVFGRGAARLEQALYADDRRNGVLHVVLCVGGAASLGVLAVRATASSRVLRTTVTALTTWAVLGGTTLAREGAYLAGALEDDDLERARARLPHLCGRDPSRLEAPELARATVESLAENTSDAVVAPLFWGAVAGVPGMLAYRAINTLDAMIGHHSPRYERFGWAAARLDDVANYVPARLTGVLTVLTAPDPGGARAMLRRDGHRHPSPNAGRCEAAFAGALGVTLGGRNVYGGRVEERPTMGDGPRPEVTDIRRAVRLTRAVSTASAVVAVAMSAAVTVTAVAAVAAAGVSVASAWRRRRS